jgi:aminoglycoside 3-N-acetyltransferase
LARTNIRGNMSDANDIITKEQRLISRTPEPRTRASLLEDLQRLGVTPGMTLLVHSSMRALGWVNGGPVTVIQALLEAVGPEGTLVMPAFSADLSDPAGWSNPPIPSEWVDTVRATMPAYDRRLTPTRAMGRIAELFRTWPGTVRSDHPSASFAARGRHAEAIVADHDLAYSLGERSPLARIYDLHGYVLLLGVGFGNNTSFHLAEYRYGGGAPVTAGAPVFEHGARTWKTYPDIDLDDSIFPQIGAAWESSGLIRMGQVGSATAQLFPQREAVDYAVRWYLERSTGGEQ